MDDRNRELIAHRLNRAEEALEVHQYVQSFFNSSAFCIGQCRGGLQSLPRTPIRGFPYIGLQVKIGFFLAER